MSVIQVEHLHKRYGDTVAVDDVSLEVRPGEIFGILGRNGAGKTTTVEIIGGLRAPDGGSVRVLGLDPVRDRARLREVVGLQLQESQLQAKITVREALDLYASFYPDPADPAALLDELGLTDRSAARFEQLSGGQKQRLSVALALVGNPQIAILDELTTGLDPHARRDTWEVVERIRARGVTIVLVTHLMEEAERLCDRIALIDAGRVVATGTPAELVGRATAEQVLRFRPSAPVPAGLLDGFGTATARDGELEVRGTGNVVQDVLVALDRHGIRPEQLRVEQSSLEDAFVALTTTVEV
jgi:ABC-2 type transport system ATP-binding protein